MSAKGQPNNPSSAYLAMKTDWDLILSLLGGTRVMRNAGETYLPRYHAETERSYKARKDRSTLLNYFKKSVLHLASRPFQKPVVLGETFPEKLKELEDDVDLLGNDLTSFSRDAFEDLLSKGLTHILVDFPKVDPNVIVTKEDEEKAEVRPYFVHVPAENLIAAYAQSVNGKEVLTHIRIMETVTVQNGFDERTIRRVRIWERESWQVWEATGNATRYTLQDQGVNQLGIVPLVTVYARRKGLMIAEPPLIDLAHKNVEHFQSSSDQRNVLTVARFPIITATGVENADELEIGPKNIWSTAKPEAKFAYLEHEGKAISAGRQDLEDIKEEMAMMSVDIMIRKTGTQTATEKGINTAQGHTELSAMALRFADALENCFSIAAKWIKLEADDENLSVEINTDFGITDATPSDLDFLFKIRQAKEISHSAFMAELIRRGVLAPGFNVEEDKELVDGEPPPLGMAGRGLPGQVPPGKEPQPKPGTTPPGKEPQPKPAPKE